MARSELELRAAAQLELERRQTNKTPIGIVHPDGHLIRTIKKIGDTYVEVNEEPRMYIAEKLEPVFTRPKRLTVIYGGRGSTKSLGVGDLVTVQIHDERRNALCLREYQSSISDSVHGLIKSEVERIGLDGFDIKDKTISHSNGTIARFNGIARNPESIKSAFGFKTFWVEESEFLSSRSLNVLTPTARNKPVNGLPSLLKEVESKEIDLDSVRIIFTGNPKSSADPFSQRFIVPFENILNRDGIYEDDLHLIIKINYYDNPWFMMSGLETERSFDEENMPTAKYRWIWLGAFNDEVDGSIIKVDWFNAAIDAHKLPHLKKAFEPKGARFAIHDPSDVGNDAKGYAARHGSIFTRVAVMDDGEIDDGCDWAMKLAKEDKADWFIWDAGGMGTGLKRQVSDFFGETSVRWHLFNGALSGSAQDNAEKIYMPTLSDGKNKEQTKPKTYSDTFLNNRAQYYGELARRFYNTYRCVKKGEYVDPADMISLDSDGVEDMERLRAEVCRIPIKENNTELYQIMSKREMAAMDIPSPNMSDCLMMGLWGPKIKRERKPIAVKRKRI